ncbi:MAG: DUF3795 domain-containing protein [Candidatus Thorarchaeota archaeon]
MRISHLHPCGAYCEDCPSYKGKNEPQCSGCTETKGNPWWGECKLCKCAQERGVEYCGVCSEFPCETSITHFDPDNAVGQRNAVVRIGVQAYRAKHGDDKALELVEKLRALEQ